MLSDRQFQQTPSETTEQQSLLKLRSRAAQIYYSAFYKI